MLGLTSAGAFKTVLNKPSAYAIYILYDVSSKPPLSSGAVHSNFIACLFLYINVNPVGIPGTRAVRILADAILSSELPRALTL